MEERTYQLSFADGVWKADGQELATAAVKASERKLGEKMHRVLELVNSLSQTTACRHLWTCHRVTSVTDDDEIPPEDEKPSTHGDSEEAAEPSQEQFVLAGV